LNQPDWLIFTQVGVGIEFIEDRAGGRRQVGQIAAGWLTLITVWIDAGDTNLLVGVGHRATVDYQLGLSARQDNAHLVAAVALELEVDLVGTRLGCRVPLDPDMVPFFRNNESFNFARAGLRRERICLRIITGIDRHWLTRLQG
jgi:hypothetical protein